MKTALIDKVYNVYENRDFSSVGCDNLNPLREFNGFKTSEIDNKNNDSAIYDSIMDNNSSNRLKAIYGDTGGSGTSAGSTLGDARAGNTLGSSVLSDTANKKRSMANQDMFDEAALIAKVRERYANIKDSLSRLMDIDDSNIDDDIIAIDNNDRYPPTRRGGITIPPPKTDDIDDIDDSDPGPGPDPNEPDPDYIGDIIDIENIIGVETPYEYGGRLYTFPGPIPDGPIGKIWKVIPDFPIGDIIYTGPRYVFLSGTGDIVDLEEGEGRGEYEFTSGDPDPNPDPTPPEPDTEPPTPTKADKKDPIPPGPDPTSWEEYIRGLIGTPYPEPIFPPPGPDPVPGLPGYNSSITDRLYPLLIKIGETDIPPTQPFDCEGIASAVNSENEEESNISSDSSDFSNLSAEDALTAGRAQETNKNELKNALQDKEILNCALKELMFLKIILIIVKIINVLRTLASIILNAAYVVIDIVQLAAGAWLNYSNIAKIANKIITRVVAIIVKIIAVLAQKLWDALNLDCVDNITISLLGQIREAISGITTIHSVMDPNAIQFGVNKIVSELQKTWNEIIENTKNAFDMERIRESGQEIVKSLQAGGNTIVQAAKDATVNRALNTWNSRVSDMQEIMASAGQLIPSAADISNAMSTLKVDLK